MTVGGGLAACHLDNHALACRTATRSQMLQALKIDRSTLYDKLKRYEITR
ncbi:MAG: hypothetical protein IPP47_12760 [Bryobacterales bacterium]|nr:hypothetical protein [Bryobacterales bacterium]